MRYLLLFIFPAFFLLWLTYLLIYFYSKAYIHSTSEDFFYPYALVLGAGLEKDGRPTDILMDRLVSAYNLYQSGKADILILSGAGRSIKNEPQAMRQSLLALGIPASKIVLDESGFSTFDSCLNLVRQFSPESVLIVTQQFHLPRAIFLQRNLGVKAYGIAAGNYSFAAYKKAWWYFREVLALPFNFLKLLIYLFKK